MSDETNDFEIRQGESTFQWISRSSKIVNKENEQISFDVLDDKKFLGIYFAANWIPVSKNYLQIIDNAVNAMEAREDSSMGMLLASCDQNDKDMIEFVSTANIGYPIIPPGSKIIESLKEKFEIEEIPILIVLEVEKNSVVDKVDKLRLESLLEKEDPDGMCNLWLGVSNPSDLAESPLTERKLIDKEKKQQGKIDKERLKKEASEKKKLDKVEKVEQKKVAKLEKQKSKDLKKQKKRNAGDTVSVNSQMNIEPMSPAPLTEPDISPGTEETTPASTPLAQNSLREGNGNLSDSSNGSAEIASGKHHKKKRLLWGRTDTPKQKDVDPQVTTLLQRNNELEHIISELKATQQEQETDNKELHAQVDTLNGTIAERDSAIKVLDDRNTELNSQVFVIGEYNKSLNEEKDKLTLELTGVKEELNLSKEELKKTQDQMEEIEKEKQLRETEHQKFLEMTELNGWMHKRGRKSFTRGMWRNRYFQAGEGFKLNYYKSPKMNNLRGSINLSDVIKVEPVENSKGNLLTISTDSTNLELRAPDETTRDSWINSITFLAEYSKKYHSVEHSTDEGADVEKPEEATDKTVTETNKEGSTEITKSPESVEIAPVDVN